MHRGNKKYMPNCNLKSSKFGDPDEDEKDIL
jgi:hypothetical protein